MSESKPLAGCRVLVIEDDYFIGMDLDQILTEAGAEVIGPIGDVQHAMQEVEKDGFGLALLDVKIRGGLVFEIADELRCHNVPFFFATGYDQAVIPDRFSDVRCWQKPITNDNALVAALAGLCRSLRASSASPASAAHP